MKQYDIGIDLGTTSIIIATEEQGVVFRQPTIGAVDTRTNTIIAVGDEALQMVGRAPAYIDLVRPLRDGVIQDHRMTNELIVRFVNEVCRSRIFKPRIAVCVPAQITGVEAEDCGAILRDYFDWMAEPERHRPEKMVRTGGPGKIFIGESVIPAAALERKQENLT